MVIVSFMFECKDIYWVRRGFRNFMVKEKGIEKWGIEVMRIIGLLYGVCYFKIFIWEYYIMFIDLNKYFYFIKFFKSNIC